MKKLLLGISITFTLLVTVRCGSNNVTTEDLKAHDWIAKTDGEDPDMTMTFSDHVIKIGIDTSSLKSTSTNEWEKIGEDFATSLMDNITYSVEYTLEKNELKMQDVEDENATTYYKLEKDDENIIFTPIEDKNDKGKGSKFTLEPYEKPKKKDSSSSVALAKTSSTIESYSSSSREKTSESKLILEESANSQIATNEETSENYYEPVSEKENNVVEPSTSNVKKAPQSQSQAQVEEYTTVLKGETPDQIASRVGISVDQLFNLNGMAPNNYMLYPGDTLRVK